MLLFPDDPNRKCAIPLSPLGEYASPTLCPKFLYRFGPSVRGTPGSPVNTQPLGAPGKTTDCTPGTIVSSWLCFSYHGVVTSQRSPKFRTRFCLARQLSWP